MFPMAYVGHSDGTQAMLYASQNGENWALCSDAPVFRLGPYGSWNGGAHFYITPNLVELPDGDFVLPYTGWNVPHKYPPANAVRNVDRNVE